MIAVNESPYLFQGWGGRLVGKKWFRYKERPDSLACVCGASLYREVLMRIIADMLVIVECEQVWTRRDCGN